MDRGRRSLIRWLAPVLAGAAFNAATGEHQPATIDLAALQRLPETAWIAPASDPVKALTREPAACLLPPDNPEHAQQIRAGELVFKSPVLLGGQAAKAGMSCHSCHRNGRGNQDFHFEGISDAPGTADVTSGIFGRQRADDVFNPVPIPDLALPDGQDQVDRSDMTALAAFTHGQIVEEFSGVVPPEPVMSALLAYVRAIDDSACDDPAASRAIDWRDDWNAARDAMRLAESSTDDQTAARFYTRMARAALQRLHDRYAHTTHTDIRQGLIALSRSIAQNHRWPGDSETLYSTLQQQANRSLYMPAVVRAAIDG